ncbi:MAG: hypothetical protein AAF533_14740 [Acidobacteriota bacterium]
MRLKPILTTLVALSFLAVTPAMAEEETKSDTPSFSSGLGKGRHHFTLFGGWHFGETAVDTDITAEPIDNTPLRLRLDVEPAATYGFRYAYQLADKWAVEFSLSNSASELANKQSFDADRVREVLGNSLLDTSQQETLFNRLESHSGPYDMDVTFFDIGVLRFIDISERWVGEVGAGIGWASTSLDDDPATFEELINSFCDPEDLNCTYIIANETEGVTGRCSNPGDPCFEATAGNGLTWWGSAGLRFMVNEQIHFRANARLRLVEQLTDPGDTFAAGEGTVGVAILFGK